MAYPETAARAAAPLASLLDHRCGGVDASATPPGDRFGGESCETAGTAADVEDPVTRVRAAEPHQPAERAPSAPGDRQPLDLLVGPRPAVRLAAAIGVTDRPHISIRRHRRSGIPATARHALDCPAGAAACGRA